MKKVAEEIPAYTYGASAVGKSPVSFGELNALRVSEGFTAEDERYHLMAGEVLDGQTKQIVAHLRSGIVASIPNPARHSRTPEGAPNPEYLAKSKSRFEQWILDICLHPYDKDWLNYQQELPLRHTSVKKNQADGVQSTAHVSFQDVVALPQYSTTQSNPTLRSKATTTSTWRECTSPRSNRFKCRLLSGPSPT